LFAGVLRVSLHQALTTGTVSDMVTTVEDMLDAVLAFPDAGTVRESG
jgi:hypothetical protein